MAYPSAMAALLAAMAVSGALGKGLERVVHTNTAYVHNKDSVRDISYVSEVEVKGEVKPFSAEVTGQILMEHTGVYGYVCEFENTTLSILWIDGHLLCNDNNAFTNEYGNFDNPLVIREGKTGWYPFRLRVMYNGTFSTERVYANVKWNVSGTIQDIPSTHLKPALPKNEIIRSTFQKSLQQGWGHWTHGNLLSYSKLPESCAVDVAMIQLSTGKYIKRAIIEDKVAQVRIGHHAADMSYSQKYVAMPQGANLNISIEFHAPTSSNDMYFRISPVDVTNCSDFRVEVSGRFAWFRAGSVDVSGPKFIKMQAYNLGETTLYIASDTKGALPHIDTISFDVCQGDIVGSTNATANEKDIISLIDDARMREEKKFEKYSEDLRDVYIAAQAAIMWNYIYTPFEEGNVLPVARGWNSVDRPANFDFTYTLFDWDNFFASHIAATLNLCDIAISNLIQIVKSITSDGFVPNLAAAGKKSEDRTEPPIGAKVLESVVKQCSTKDNNLEWVVELLLDDLISWNNWFFRRREKDGLICLGSYNLERDLNGGKGDEANYMQAARWESGLDNSPMYDGSFYDNVTHLMQSYDVGFSSMVSLDAFILANFCRNFGRGAAVQNQLIARGVGLVKRILEELWDEENKVFVNKFYVNDTLSSRVSPTSFYPLLTGYVPDDQAESMINGWLFNSSRFCIAPSGDFKGNSDDCFWGLPSISADDVAYPPLGYWRGYVWGPMAQLTYWSLETAAKEGSQVAKKAKSALASQMRELMLSQWHKNRHICENYNPHKTADTSGGDCSGDKFYHWGALTGLLSILESRQ